MKKILLILLITTFTLFAKPDITIYNAYSNNGTIYINGRLIKEDFIDSSKSDSIFKNIINKTKLLFHNELKNSKVYILVNKKLYSTTSDEEGYFDISIKQKSHKATIFTNKESEALNVDILQYNNPKVGIISDFDDTIIVSNVPNRLKLIQNTLTKNYKQREIVKKTEDKIKSLLRKYPKTPFIVVSGSPYQLYRPIKNFLNYHKFPKAVVLLKQIHGVNKEPIDQFKYKVAKIERLFKHFPKTKWYLFGDSGEKDREVYQYLKREYPNRVVEFSIREVSKEN